MQTLPKLSGTITSHRAGGADLTSSRDQLTVQLHLEVAQVRVQSHRLWGDSNANTNIQTVVGTSPLYEVPCLLELLLSFPVVYVSGSSPD